MSRCTSRARSRQAWLTIREARGAGGHVRKGERGTTIIYASRFTPKDERVRAEEPGEESMLLRLHDSVSDMPARVGESDLRISLVHPETA